MKTLTLLVRAYCHLCDQMLAAVQPVAAAYGLTLEVVDIEEPGNAALEAAWGDRAPVLFAGPPQSGTALCHYHFDRARFEQALDGPI